MMRITLTIVVALAMIACGAAIAQDAEAPAEAAEEAAAEQPQAVQGGERVQGELIALYRFDDVIEGGIIPDTADELEGLDLVIQGAIEGTPVQVREDCVHFGAAEIVQAPGLFSSGPATELVNALRATAQLTVEAWVTPAAGNLTGPARIATISRGTGERNITLGQQGDTFSLRLRTSENRDGMPDLRTPDGSLRVGELQHVVVTFFGELARIYLDGELVAETNHFAGTLDNWDETMSLVIGNETDGNRRWLGAVHLVAFYRAALNPEGVVMNFEAGL